MDSNEMENEVPNIPLKWLWDLRRRERKIWKKMSIDERHAYAQKRSAERAAMQKS